MNLRQLILVGVVMELAYLSFYLLSESPNEVLLFIGVNAFAFLLLTVVYLKIQTANLESQTVLVILGFAILFRLTLVFHPPVASDDIYRYVWDGKVAAHGINPFRYAPTDSSLAGLHTGDFPAKINHPAMRTIYPPLAQLLFFISNKSFGDSISWLKFLLVLADIATILLLVQLSKRGKHNGSSMLLYAWSPLPVMYFGLDGHIDALGIPFLLLFILLAGRNRYFASAISLGLAGLAKLYPLFVAPFLFFVTKGWKRFVLPLIPIAMLVACSWFYWEPTAGLIESFMVFNSRFEFNGSVFNLMYALFGTNSQAHVVCSILFLVWLGVVFFLKRSILEGTFLAFLGFIVFAPVVQPWYLTWLAALLVLRWSMATWALLGLSNLSNVTVYTFRLNGVWDDHTLVLLMEYIPFFLLLVWEMAKPKAGMSSEPVSAIR